MISIDPYSLIRKNDKRNHSESLKNGISDDPLVERLSDMGCSISTPLSQEKFIIVNSTFSNF